MTTLINIPRKSLAQIIEERKASSALKKEDMLLQQASFDDIAVPLPTTSLKPSLTQILAMKKAAYLAKQQNDFIADCLQPDLPVDTKEIDLPLMEVETITSKDVGRLDILASIVTTGNEIIEQKQESFALSIELNQQQLLARDMALTGKSFCYIGAAGTGKTTGLREIARSLLQSDSLRTHTFRVQGTTLKVDAPSIAVVAWTRIASGNARRAIHKDPYLASKLPVNITTAHNLLEFYPEFFYDESIGKESMRFVPKRNKYNKLTITHLMIEEASLIDLPMWNMIYEALHPGVQIIFIGDINQLPPVFGPSILNYGLIQLPVVELTHVYRQQGESLVLENAHRILEGKALLEGTDFEIVRCGDVQHSQEKLSVSLGATFPKWMDAGAYDPETDIILSPWNKKDLGTDTINKWIAQHLGVKRGAVVHHIKAGRTQHYLAIGDKIMYNKMAGKITKITLNASYMGSAPKTASNSLSRFGDYVGVHSDSEEFELAGYDNLDIDKIIDGELDLAKQCSHIVDILTDDEVAYTLETIGDFSASSFSLGYALTVHKSQGCEWRRVFFVMHRDHKINLCREMLYTAVTRAREKVILIAKEHLINSTIAIQRLKGNNLREKIEYFNTGLLNQEDVQIIK